MNKISPSRFPKRTIARKNGGRIDIVTYSKHWAIRVYSGVVRLPNGAMRSHLMTACHTGLHSNKSWKTKLINRYKDN